MAFHVKYDFFVKFFTFCFTQEAWQFLVHSTSKGLQLLSNAGFSLPTFDVATETESSESASSWDSSALLSPYIPSVIFVFHLIHEVNEIIW